MKGQGMYQVLIWNDNVGDFVEERDVDNHKVFYNTEDEAYAVALKIRTEGGLARTQYVRKIVKKPKPKYMRAGRVIRNKAVQFDGEWCTVVGILENGKVVKK